MFCTDERNGCGHFEDDGCPNYRCEWSAFDAPREERFVNGAQVDNGGRAFDGRPVVQGQPVVTDVNLSYLGTMTPGEAALMASWARELVLDEASWGRAREDRWCAECRGEWRACDYCRSSEEAVQDFLDRHERGVGVLTEGLILYWGNDIAGELRLFRGWCPHLPYDKRLATEERQWRAD